jgi:hypothetical protein
MEFKRYEGSNCKPIWDTIQEFDGGTGENHKNLNQDSQLPDRNLNTGPPEYVAEVTPNWPQHLVTKEFNSVAPQLATARCRY